MAAKTKAIKVDDVEYTITQIGGVEGGELFDRLTQELGPAVIEGIRQALTSSEKKATEAVLAAVIVRAIVALSPALKNDLRWKFAQLTTVDTGSVMLPLATEKKLQVGDSFDQHFAGRFPHMTKWLVAAMQWGFAGGGPNAGGADDKPPVTPTPSS